MIKKTLYFSEPVYLNLDKEQLVVNFKDTDKDKRTIPIEDIGLVIVDHYQVTVTHSLINALITNNAALLWCDNKHMPNGLVLPLRENHIFTEKLKHQLSASLPLKKQLWKQTVQIKIKNQASVLNKLGFDTENMHEWADKTGSGDPKNMESRAANYYWKCLFENIDRHNVTRHRFGDAPNNMFNYGYAILRAVVARSLVASGCLPAVGIHHRNKYNAFCLADDIMEPYRPYVDELVLEWVFSNDYIESDLTKEMKAHLLSIPVIDVQMNGAKSPLMIAMQHTTASLMACFEGTSKKINFPEI